MFDQNTEIYSYLSISAKGVAQATTNISNGELVHSLAVNYCWKTLDLKCLRGSWLRLYSLYSVQYGKIWNSVFAQFCVVQFTELEWNAPSSFDRENMHYRLEYQ